MPNLSANLSMPWCPKFRIKEWIALDNPAMIKQHNTYLWIPTALISWVWLTEPQIIDERCNIQTFMKSQIKHLLIFIDGPPIA